MMQSDFDSGEKVDSVDRSANITKISCLEFYGILSFLG